MSKRDTTGCDPPTAGAVQQNTEGTERHSLGRGQGGNVGSAGKVSELRPHSRLDESGLNDGEKDRTGEEGEHGEHLNALQRLVSRATTRTIKSFDPGPAPDGGREAWLCVFATSLQMFSIFGFMTSNGQLQIHWLEHQLKGQSKSTVAWIGSIQTLVEFSLAMFTGRYFDIHGARTLVMGCTVLSAVAMVGMAFSKEFYQFFLSFVLFGAAGSLIYAPSGALAAQWFTKRRGLAVGLITLGSGLGGVIYPIMMQRLFSVMSYRNAMLIIMGFNVVLMTPGVFFMKARLPPRLPPPFSDMKHPWKEVRYVFLVSGCAFFFLNLLSPYYFAIDYARGNNVRPGLAEYAVAICQSGGAVGRLASGMLGDRFGVWNAFGALGPISAVIMFGLWAPPVGTAGTMVGLVSYGLVSGGWFTLAPAACAAISPVHEAGMRIGMLITALAVPSLVGPVVVGKLIQVGDGKWTYTAVFCGLTYIISGILVIAPPLWAWVRVRTSRSGKSSCATSQASPQVNPVGKSCDDRDEVDGTRAYECQPEVV